MNDIRKEIKRLSNLKQNKDKSRTWVERQAKINVWKKQVSIKKRFDKRTEKKFAEDLFNNYLQNYEFDNFSDINTLSDLVYEEVLKKRLQDLMNNISDNEKNNFISDKMVKNLHQTEDRVLALKEKLGIGNKDKNDDDLTALQKLIKRYSAYIPLNRHEFTTVCSYCGKMLLLRRRVKDFDCLKHPAFAGRFLYNKEIFNDVENGKLDKKRAAAYLRTSPDYIDWAIENRYKFLEMDSVPQEKIDEVVDNTSYLDKSYKYKKKEKD